MLDRGQTATATSLFGSDGRTVIVAMDHALAAGQITPLDDPAPLLRRVLAGEPDGLILTQGMRRLEPTECGVPWLLTSDYYGTAVKPGATGEEELHRFLWSAAEAHARGASGLKCLLVFGRRDPQALLDNVSEVARLLSDARAVGLPVMVEATLWGRNIPVGEQNEAAAVAHAARIAFELGADIIKIPIPDDVKVLERLAGALPVPLVLMGGPRVDAAGLFAILRDAVDAGARGVALGRNVWGSDDPTGFVRALRMLVHDGGSPTQALEMMYQRRLDSR